MGIIRDKLNAMVVHVIAPDGGVEGDFVGGRRVEIAFREDRYFQYHPDNLSSQLEHILQQWFTGYDHGRLAIRQAVGRPIEETAKPHWNSTVRDFRQALLESEFEGNSAREFVRVKCIGRRDFTVRFKPDALDELSEDEFAAEFSTAVSDLISDIKMVSDMLKQEHFYGRG